MDTLSSETLPVRIEDEAALEEVLWRPSRAPIEELRGIEGDVLIRLKAENFVYFQF